MYHFINYSTHKKKLSQFIEKLLADTSVTVMIYESRLSRLLIVNKIATMLALVFGRDRIKLQRAAKDVPKCITSRFRVVDAKERKRERKIEREKKRDAIG